MRKNNVGSFFKTWDFIAMLEDRAMKGDNSALHKMTSKTHLILGERQGILRKELPPLGHYDRLVFEVCEHIKKTGCTIAEAFIASGRTDHGAYPYLTDFHIQIIHDTRKEYGKNKSKKHWYK